jgi:hypothetical protein
MAQTMATLSGTCLLGREYHHYNHFDITYRSTGLDGFAIQLSNHEEGSCLANLSW